jgi:stage V sporulation protein K
VQRNLVLILCSLAVLIVIFAIAETYAGIIFVVSIAIMGWRLALAPNHGIPRPRTRGAEGGGKAMLPAREAGNRPLDEILAELDAMTGWRAVKVEVHKLVAVLQAEQERRRHGINPTPSSLHLVFLGNPGTGKPRPPALWEKSFAVSACSDQATSSKLTARNWSPAI